MKKPSDTSLELPEQPEFFVDYCLGSYLVTRLREAGLVVHAHLEHFAQACEDVDWIPVVSANGWLIITKDQNIRRHPFEREVMLHSGARAFIITSGNLARLELAELVLRQLEFMKRCALEVPAPFIVALTRGEPNFYHPPELRVGPARRGAAGPRRRTG